MQTPTKAADSTTNASDQVAPVSPEGLPAPPPRDAALVHQRAGRISRSRLNDMRASRAQQLIDERVRRARLIVAARLLRTRQLLVAHTIISICCLPLPLLAILAALVRPGFVADIQARQTAVNYIATPYVPFITFGTALLLVGYHVLMFWYNPFAVDSRAVQRKRWLINGISFFLSIPIVSALIVTTLGTKKDTSAMIALLEKMPNNFPLYPWMLALVVVAAVGWCLWLLLNRPWFKRLVVVQKTEVNAYNFWLWLRRERYWLGVWYKRWRGKLLFFALTIVLFSSLLSEMMQMLGLGLGFGAAIVVGLLQLKLIEVTVFLDFVWLHRRGLGWLFAAWLGVQGGTQELVKDAVGIHDDVPGVLTYAVEVEMILGIGFLIFWLGLIVHNWWQLRRTRPPATPTV
ncbi:MAG: hypothetical protein DLM69_08795 [Candidatus Chloroheliales bacterium]|nr:MAG: hypothetical protein DLM69_08795 [Chloroflexota bacterium]